MVPETGVEPVRNFVAADFKSATSTNSVIPAPKPMLRTLSGFRSVQTKKGSLPLPFFLEFWSGRRVSNSRPQPWQGCALPTELLPHSSCEEFEFYTVFRDWQEHSSKKNEKYHKHGIQRSFFRRFQAIRGGRAPLARPYSDRPPSLRLSKPSGRRAHACARACR